MPSVTVTELVDWQDCPLVWYYHDKLGLRPKVRPATLASGTAVHKVLEGIVRGVVGDVEVGPDIRLAAESALAEQGLSDEDVARFTPGVIRAVERAPEWLVRGEGWRAESSLAWIWDDIEVRGRPDFYRVSDDEVELVEVKTTDSDPLDYLLFNPQHRYYAVLLSKLHPDRLVTFRYVCLPVGADEEAKTHESWPMLPRVLATAEQEMLDVAREIIGTTPRPRWSWRCRRCDYVRLDTARVQGQEWEGIAKEEFRVEHKG